MFSCKTTDVLNKQTKKIIIGNTEKSIDEIRSEYTGKNLYELLNNIKENYKENYPIDEPPGKLIGWSFYYNEYDLRIYFKYKNEYFDIKRNWKLENYLNEEITYIE
jgi:hypothetical protein